MSCRHLIPVLAFVAAAVVCGVRTASAQTGGRTPQGLFGPVRAEALAKTKLDVTATLVEGYDGNVAKQISQLVDPYNIQSGGFSTTLEAAVDYSKAGKRADLVATASSNLRYYARLGETRSIGHSAAVGTTVRLPQRTSLMFNQAATYQPSYFYDLFPTGATVEPGSTSSSAPDYSVASFESYLYASTVGVRHEFTPRVELSASGDYWYTDRLKETPEWRDVTSHSAHVDYSQHLSRNAAFTMAYRYRKGTYGFAGEAQTIEHGLEVGANLTKPFSASRRAQFDFSIGMSGSDIPAVSVIDSKAVDRRYLASGQVAVSYDFGRTWQARGNFRRGFEYIVDLPQPVFADGVGASVVGLLARRVDLLVSAGYSSGESVLNRDALYFDTYTGNVRVRYGMTKTWATYVEYLYYYYDFRGNTLLAPGMPASLERNGARAGLTWWVPALRK